jgi:hypothetical protein
MKSKMHYHRQRPVSQGLTGVKTITARSLHLLSLNYSILLS